MDSIQEAVISMWKRKRLKPEQLAVNVSEETRRKIEEEAEAEDISLSAWIGRAIEVYLENTNSQREEKIK